MHEMAPFAISLHQQSTSVRHLMLLVLFTLLWIIHSSAQRCFSHFALPILIARFFALANLLSGYLAANMLVKGKRGVSDEDGDVIIIAVSFFVRETLSCSSGRDKECCEMCVVSGIEQDFLKWDWKYNMYVHVLCDFKEIWVSFTNYGVNNSYL